MLRSLGSALLSLRIFGLLFVWLALLPCCGRPEPGSPQHSRMRCESDGLCLQAIDKRSLEGAYRRGDEELRFDVLYSPSGMPQTQYRDEWSIRLLDPAGHAFFTSPSSHPPPAWSANSVTYKGPDAYREQTPSHLDERDRLMRELTRTLAYTKAPHASLREPFEQFRAALPHVYGNGISLALPATLLRSKEVSLPLTSSPKLLAFDEDDDDTALASQPRHHPTGEDLLDDMAAHEDHAQGIRAVGDDPLPLATWSGFEKKTGPKLFHAEYIHGPGLEFQQEIDLYWQPTRSFLAFGWNTKKHHTAACIRIKQRALDSNEPWRLLRTHCTENHGAKAGGPGMKLYAQCRQFPVTREYAAWGGECGGTYPSHFCNDDTALQIHHAYGDWEGGRRCAKRKRTHRPSCENPW